jgi:hypothetical protein
LSAWPKHVVFDRAFPLSASAAAGVDHHDMSHGDLLAAVLVTHLEGQGRHAAADQVRAAMAMAAGEFPTSTRARGAGQHFPRSTREGAEGTA